MRLVTLLLAALTLALTGLAAGPTRVEAQGQSSAPLAATGPQRTERIEAELVPMSAWATPGSTVIVAVRQKIERGWHTYWRNPGDSGGPTTLDWTLLGGVTAGDIVWPLPERQRLQTLMNFGYSGVVYLPVPIEVPASARPGETLHLSADALFMVCSDEMCVPDELTLALDLPVREGAAPLDPKHGAAIQAVVEGAARPAGITARAMMADGVLTLTATGGPLTGAAPRQAFFFPFKGGLIDHAAVQTGERGPDGVTLKIKGGRGLLANGLGSPIAGVLMTDAGAWEIEAAPGPALAGAAGDGALSTDETTTGAASGLGGFAQAALFALLGGLILNLMPCVFPILAMKAASLARSAHDPGEARRDGLAFLAGVLAAFLTLAGALLALRAGGQAIGWGFQLQSPAVVGGLALLMLAVGLNLSGVFEIGGGLQAAGQGRLSRLPGGAGAFFTGVLAVVVAAPCTAPFMAVALGAALLMPWPMALAVFAMLGLGLALPYVAISLSPGLLRRFPRPGAWMERLKALLAFPMYGAALWLAWVFMRQAGPDALALLFVSGLLASLTLWLFGLRQKERAEGRPGRLALIAVLITLIAFAAFGWLGLRAPAVPAGEVPPSGALASQPWSEAAVAAARAEGRPVLVNFTADWCVTCKINERGALSSARVVEAMTAANAVYLVGDWTRRDDAITRELERRGRSGVPLYLFYAPGADTPRILPQLLGEGVVIDALSGRS
ncbi:MAG: thiol:disulfide interchange protein [Brevundimonas sp.]|uniref:protein-disulfide reductase DsbD family protein n=1 Tax=Brevundimonas sp. TaxID=1871086 RepID=UPI001200E663|nr:thioredoxin family protein [Brevundimonas sp.]RZJ17320.1 MAG: thiol:disulfide interchange protein [Brevundimonas sp.]